MSDHSEHPCKLVPLLFIAMSRLVVFVKDNMSDDSEYPYILVPLLFIVNMPGLAVFVKYMSDHIADQLSAPL